jgi:5-formyltetrahydrofolate cyclo-ligase
MSIPGSKKELRERIWRLLEEKGEARFPWPVRGRIPNFNGSHEAARRLLGLKEFKEAKVVKINPDYPQRTVRKSALASGKTLLMPTPRLKGGFLFLDPLRIPKNQINKASTIKGAFRHGIEKGLHSNNYLPLILLFVAQLLSLLKEIG